MPLGPATTLCISLAARPSVFGMTIHNAAYKALGLDFLYKACRVTEIGEGMRAVRALGIRGCSVSMPYKESVIPHLDAVDHLAATIGAVNTVVNDSGSLTGFNTDLYGALVALDSIAVQSSDRVLLLGAGGAARAIVQALAERGVTQITIVTRSRTRVDWWEQRGSPASPVRFVDWAARDTVPCEVLINATPIGMVPEQESMPISQDAIRGSRVVFDVVVRRNDSPLVACARALGRPVATGTLMMLHQAAKQFQLYTGQEPPLAVMEDAMCELLNRA